MRRMLLVLLLVAPIGCVRLTIMGPAHQVLIVLDGLRPDYVTPEIMPNLYALGQRGVVFSNHHSVYPTVTRVNASSIATGTYPEVHGLMGNSVFFPQVDSGRFLDTSDRVNLLRIRSAVDGKLLTAPTLGDLLQPSRQKVLAVSSGSSGSAFLLNYTVAGGAILHNEYTLPESLAEEMTRKLGPNPPTATPNDAQNRRAVDALLQIGFPQIDPSVTLLWLSDPDETAHAHGLGEPTTVEALKRVDAEVQRLLDNLSGGLSRPLDIWVTSDHGFSTSTAAPPVNAILKQYSGTLPDGSPRIVAGSGAIYVRDHDRTTIAAIVRDLQHTPGVGAIFTRSSTAGSFEGSVPGTLSFDAIRWNHDRAADILYSPDWTDDKNQFGVPGSTASGGVANHGSSSPYDVHNVLIAAGPDLKEHTVLATPSGNVDFTPTFLHLLGVAIPPSVKGRVLEEALRNTRDAGTLKVETSEANVKTTDGAYSLTGRFSTVTTASGQFRYFDYTRVLRN